MGKPASAIGDIAGHAGAIATGSLNVLIGGRPAARKGDTIICPLHGAGVIALGSFTVLINGMGAARLGDLTGCIVPGLAPISIPIPMLGPPALPAPPAGGAMIGPSMGPGSGPMLGPPPQPAPPLAHQAAPIEGALGLGPGNNKMHAVNDKSTGGGSAMHMEGSITDANSDGYYDTAEGSIEGARLRNAGQTNVGPVEVGGTHSMDILYANARASAMSGGPDQGGSISGSAEAGMMKWAVGGTVGAQDSHGLNAGLGAGAEVNMMHAKAEGDLLSGTDGTRTGFIMRGEAGAEALKGEISTVVTSPSVGGYNIQFTQKGGAAAGTVGGGAGIWAFFNHKESRLHVGAMAKLKLLFGLEGEWDVSVGKEYKEDPAPAPPPAAPVAALPSMPGLFGGYANTPGLGAGGLPGAIMLGNPMVLIGG